MAKVSRPVLYLGLGALVVAVYLLTAPDQSSGIKPFERRSSGPESREEQAQYTDADFNAEFPPVELAANDAFQPLILRGDDAEEGVSNAIPTSFTAGEMGWIYTGTATVDGVPMALVENSETLDGAFLVHGDRWKGSVVAQITPKTLLLANASGDTITLRIVGFDEIGEGRGMVPFNITPSLEGTIAPNARVNIEPDARILLEPSDNSNVEINKEPNENAK